MNNHRKDNLQFFNSLIVEALQILISKILQLTAQVNKLHFPQPHRASLINITDKNSIGLWKNKQMGSPGEISELKTDFEVILHKINEFKESGFDRKRIQSLSPSIVKSFQYEESESNVVKIEESLKKQVGDVRERVQTLQEDIGQILELCKDIILDK